MPAPDLLLTVQILDAEDKVIEERVATTYRKLLEAAHAAGLREVKTRLVLPPSALSKELVAVKATVSFPKGSFSALGDASPETVPEKLVGATVRVAETRAVARAIRAALGIAFVAVEELPHPVRFVQKEREEPRAPSNVGARQTTPATNGFSTPRPPHRFGNGASKDAPTSRASERQQALSDDQKRLVFRLVYSLGASREGARERVLEALGVKRLEHATKQDGTRAIENLKREVAAKRNMNEHSSQNGAAPHAN